MTLCPRPQVQVCNNIDRSQAMKAACRCWLTFPPPGKSFIEWWIFSETTWICGVCTRFYNIKVLQCTDCRKHECLEWCRQDVLISYLMENISCIWRHPQIQQGQPLNHCKATADWSACQSSSLSLLTNLNTSPMSTHECPLLENVSVIRATTLCQLKEEHAIV